MERNSYGEREYLFFETLLDTKPEVHVHTVECSFGNCGLIMESEDAQWFNNNPYCYDHYEQARDDADRSQALDSQDIKDWLGEE